MIPKCPGASEDVACRRAPNPLNNRSAKIEKECVGRLALSIKTA